jgi:hypothetical protein
MLPTSRSSYKWSPWTNIDRWSEPRAMGHPLPPSPSSRGWTAFSKPMSPAGRLILAWGLESPGQSANSRILLRFTGSVNRRGGDARRGAHDSKQSVSYDRVIASRNRRYEFGTGLTHGRCSGTYGPAPLGGQEPASVNSMMVGSVATREWGVPGVMCSHDPGTSSSSSPSTVKRSRPDRT